MSHPNLGRRLAVLVAALAVFSTACLNDTYRIPRRDLAVLAGTPPEQRGERVRVIQSMGGSDEPPAATGVNVNTGVVVVVDGSGPNDSHPVNSSGPHKGANVPSAKVAADDGRAWIIAAIIVGLALATTEGARFDGWVKLHPMHPVHLYGPYGEYVRVPLAQLTPELASWASHGVVRETEGPFHRLGRAPLNRVGFNYSILLGYAEIPSSNDTEAQGFMGHMEFGVFPVQHLGIVADIGFGWRQNELDLVVFDARYALGLQVLPLAAGSFSAGGYGQVGFATRIEDGPPGRDDASQLYGGGVLAQLELTTRLTVTGRAGLTWVHGERVSEYALGISIY